MLTVGGAEDREAGQYAAPQLFISSSLTLTVLFLSFERTRVNSISRRCTYMGVEVALDTSNHSQKQFHYLIETSIMKYGKIKKIFAVFTFF